MLFRNPRTLESPLVKPGFASMGDEKLSVFEEVGWTAEQPRCSRLPCSRRI